MINLITKNSQMLAENKPEWGIGSLCAVEERRNGNLPTSNTHLKKVFPIKSHLKRLEGDVGASHECTSAYICLHLRKTGSSSDISLNGYWGNQQNNARAKFGNTREAKFRKTTTKNTL